MKDTETIYKLVGPVLLKQEKFEVENTVKGRLEFIGNEMYDPTTHWYRHWADLGLSMAKKAR